MLGGPCAEKLAPFYDEFLRWREILGADFTRFMADKMRST